MTQTGGSALSPGHVRDLIAEREPDIVSANDMIRDGWKLVHAGRARHIALAHEMGQVVSETPALSGRDLGYDPNIDGWRMTAEQALDVEITKPYLTANAIYKLDQIDD